MGGEVDPSSAMGEAVGARIEGQLDPSPTSLAPEEAGLLRTAAAATATGIRPPLLEMRKGQGLSWTDPAKGELLLIIDVGVSGITYIERGGTVRIGLFCCDGGLYPSRTWARLIERDLYMLLWE